ncbi:MAG: hypothetical protein Q8N99_01485 [Nanoarchaeota archaeon]|nr:hypothetical protein [Nanoarchaeota archaeon]
MSRNIDKALIEKQAKDILNKFSIALEKVEKEHIESFFIDRDEFDRKEKNISKPKQGFKEKILKNAPNKDKDFIIAEKGGWK